MKFTKYAVRSMTKAQSGDPDVHARFERIYATYSGMRSEVIDAALEIENTLTIILLHAFVGEDYSKHRLLRAFVFEAEFFSFMQKRRMLSLLFETFQSDITCLSAAEAKLLRRELSEIIETRNIFAHGHIFIDARTEKTYIKHYQAGPKETEVTEVFLAEFMAKCERCSERMGVLNAFVRKQSFELAGP